VVDISIHSLETLFGLYAAISGAGLIVTAKDFYKMRAELQDKVQSMELEHLEMMASIRKEVAEKYVSKELHCAEVASLKSDMSTMVSNQKDMQTKIDKIYDILIQKVHTRG
jgi:hypothetical protein